MQITLLKTLQLKVLPIPFFSTLYVNGDRVASCYD